MRDWEIVDLIDKDFRSRYKPIEKLMSIGTTITSSNVKIEYRDGLNQLSCKMSKKETLRLVYESRRSKKELKNVTFEIFEEKYKEGVDIDKIEEAVGKEQLPFEGKAKK